MNSVHQQLLEVDRLRIRFNAQEEAVSGITFFINSGEVLGLVGESGSGKSATSLAFLTFSQPLLKFKVHYAGREVKSPSTQ